MMKTITLKKGRERSVQRMHPWIFSGGIQSFSEKISEGEIVRVVDVNQKFQALGFYEGGSLAVKLLSFEDVNINVTWLTEQIRKAQSYRRQLSLPSKKTTAYRLVHGEGDGLPGLIIDIYGEVAVVQPHSVGMTQRLAWIKEALNSLGFETIVNKPVGKAKPEVLSGSVNERISIKEDGVGYQVDVIGGQKTGFFLDQRDNRRLLGQMSKGANVLNVFSYTGGFSMSAAVGGAKSVVSVDASGQALEVAEANAQLNDVASIHTSVKTDAIPFLESLDDEFDIIVLDPPAFAKHKSARHAAIQAYRRINQAAMKRLQPGGILLTFSCSQVVDRAMFDNMVLSASVNLGRRVQILHKVRQPADHPVSLSHPEGEYLKGLVLRMLD